MTNNEIKLQLKELMLLQLKVFGVLLNLLEEQHLYIVKNDVFNMEAVVEKIQKCNQQIASLELRRRDITKGLLENKTFGKLIEEMKDKELENSFKKIRGLLHEIQLQKDTNELLIKQGLSFTNRMLLTLNPDRQAKTYNGYGKIIR
ncbi:flagellar protein FlgN [Clostridium thermopalmarium]|uniref:FlgN protein n=1 Tax=Clostridium thermopalmarium DSM 5974 TaxID=1121340 RepID=A0A2T0AX50_9CLOT|nr:flagellar protein FlgN [Clostridium thermopalmarium]PRR75386.1 FlgN protein [Clostridium thermopalmarium DSM 5974]PVZ24288.1 FlgN protein [Clostridium thermopalmarium DSM 5974]